MSNADKPRTLYATFTAQPGHEAEVAELIRAHAVTVRSEAGNQIFEISQKTDNPAEFFVYEEYANEAAFQAHISADYNAAFNEKLLPHIMEANGPALTWLTTL